MKLKNKFIHMVGIGGIGMSGLAIILSRMGCRVSGSDIEESDIIKRLRKKGIKINIGHSSSNVKNHDFLVFSSCIRGDNPELKAARKKRINVISRSELLKYVMDLFPKVIAVTGTHGKTTITAMASHVLKEAGYSPTVIIGGESPHFSGNAKLGGGDVLVCEVDESDGRFTQLRATHIIVSNLEMEHPEFYKSEKILLDSFKKFLASQRKESTLYYGREDRNLKRVLRFFKGKKKGFGILKGALRTGKVKTFKGGTHFDSFLGKKKIASFTLQVPGKHNVQNALPVISLAMDMGIGMSTLKRAIKSYRSVKRRFEIKGRVKGVTVVEDYAHHPTEIRATIAAAKSYKSRKIITIFQPHRYTRTKSFYKDFARCFSGSGEVILTDVYSASEKPIKDVGTENIFKLMQKEKRIKTVLLNKDSIADYVSLRAKKGDMVLVLGAGDVGYVSNQILKKLKRASFLDESKILLKSLLSGVKNAYCGERLSGHTSFRIGGPCKVWAEPEDEEELISVVRSTNAANEKIFIMGAGTNVLCSDKGFGGVVIHLGSAYFKRITFEKNKVKVRGGVRLSVLLDMACRKGFAGLEGLVGIPGTVGGAIFMNASYKGSISDFLESIKVMDLKTGKTSVIKKSSINFAYRHSGLNGYIILEATFLLKKMKKDYVAKRRQSLYCEKLKEQPLGERSAGCVFKNPKRSKPAALYIDILGFKGKRIGDALVSPKHANFIVNLKKATSSDVQRLINKIKKNVKKRFDINLEREIVFL